MVVRIHGAGDQSYRIDFDSHEANLIGLYIFSIFPEGKTELRT